MPTRLGPERSPAARAIHAQRPADYAANACSSWGSTPACPAAATAWSTGRGRAALTAARRRGDRDRPDGARCPSGSSPCSTSCGPWWPSSGPRPWWSSGCSSRSTPRRPCRSARPAGVALVAAAEAGCEVAQYTANEVKQALVGYGAATKEQVQRMVAQVLGLPEPPRPPDVADALALAVCHLTTVPLRGRAVGRRHRRASRVIGSLRGVAGSTGPAPGEVIVDVGGVGYRVSVPDLGCWLHSGRHGQRGVPPRPHPRARGRHRPLRLRARRRAALLRGAARLARGRARRWPWPSWRRCRRRRCPPPCSRTTSTPCARCPGSGEDGGPAADRAEEPARPARPVGERRADGRRRGRLGPRGEVRAALIELGYGARRDPRGARRLRRRRPVEEMLRSALRELAGADEPAGPARGAGRRARTTRGADAAEGRTDARCAPVDPDGGSGRGGRGGRAPARGPWPSSSARRSWSSTCGSCIEAARQAPPAGRPPPLRRPARAGQDVAGRDRGRRDGRRASGSPPGPVLTRAGDLAALLTDLQEGDVLFIDEIHRLHRSVEEMLYPAMEDFKLDILIGKGPTARCIRLDLPRFTLVGATTRTGLVAGPAPRPLRLRRSARPLRRRRPAGHRDALGPHPRRPGRRRGRPADRRAVPGHAADRQPAAAPGAGLRRGAGRRDHHRRRPPSTGSSSSASTSWASTRSTGPSSTCCAAGSPASRSA